MHTRVSLLAISAFLCAPLAHGANLTRSTMTEVVKDVSIINPSTKAARGTKVNEVFSTPDILRTGPDSRAEMVAEDQTVTRIGANTLFSFEPNKREINLQRGSVLFNAPTGKGGGTIKTAAATAAVLGTTLIVVTTKDGGFKVLLIEGKGQVTSSTGGTRSLNAGQMVFVLPGQGLSPVYTFQIREQTGKSLLVRGFRTPLPSLPKITAAIATQDRLFAKGNLQRTGLLAGDRPGEGFRMQTIAQETLSPAAGTAARAFPGDAIIASPQLELSHLYSPEITGGPFVFLADNTFVRTPSVDLTPFTGPGFVFVSTNDLVFEKSVKFQSAPDLPISFFTGGAIVNAPGTVVQFDNESTAFYTAGTSLPQEPITDADAVPFSQARLTDLRNFELMNRRGNLEFNAPELHLSNAGMFAGRDLNLRAINLKIENDITALQSWAMGPAGVVGPGPMGFAIIPKPDTSFSPIGTALEAGKNLSIEVKKNLTAINTDFVAENTKLRAERVLLNSVRFSNRDFDQNRGSVSIAANNLLEVAGARFQARNVSLSGATIILRNMSFAQGSTVNLYSALGLLAPGANGGTAPIQQGYVNFVKNVNYGANQAQLAIGSGITISKRP